MLARFYRWVLMSAYKIVGKKGRTKDWVKWPVPRWEHFGDSWLLPALQLPFEYIWLDGGAWWAAVYGVAQSWTRLKQLRRRRRRRRLVFTVWITILFPKESCLLNYLSRHMCSFKPENVSYLSSFRDKKLRNS